MKKYILLLLVSLFLFSCTPQPEPVSQEVAAQPQSTSPYDGNWEGTGTTKDGKEFIISFQVKGGILTSIKYQYEGTIRHTPCFITHYSPIPETERPEIKDDGFAVKLGRDLDISARFTSPDSVEGHLFADVYYRYELCNGVFDLDWSAHKQVEQPQQAVAEKPIVKKSPFEIFVQIIIFGLSNGAVLALNAIGVTLIYGTVRTLNLAHGDVFALSTVAVTSIVNILAIQADWSPGRLVGGLLLAGTVAIAVGAGLSMGVNQLAFKPFRGHSRLAPLIATLGLSFILFQGALVWRTFQASWSPGEHRSVPGLPEVPTDGIPNLLPNTDLVQALHLPVQIVFRFSDLFVLGMALLFVGLATWFLYRSSTGKALRALAQNQTLAQMVGINVDSTINRAFAVGGALAGAAAFIFALYYGRPFGTHGAQSGLLAFTAALLGGIGSPVGALLSSLSIGVVSSLSDYYLSAQWTNIITLGLLIALIAWRPHGLAGGADAEHSQVRDSVILAGAGSGLRVKRWVTMSLVALALIPILQYVFGLGGQIILRSIVIFILLSLGLNIALGFTGLLDFGYAASFGLGAYTGGLVLSHGGNFWFALIASMVVSGLLGLFKGLLASRIRDDFLAVSTLALGLLVRQLIINFDFTGGSNGISGLTALHFPVPYLLLPTMNYYLVFGFVLLGTLLSLGLAVSRLGRAWIASSEDETAALASGVNVPLARMSALVLSSVIAGVAGVLHAGTITYVDPELFSFYISSLTLTMVILGGAGSVQGMLIGAATIILYDKVIVPQFADWVALLWPKGLMIGSVPDIRGASYFNFGVALYLTVLLRARANKKA